MSFVFLVACSGGGGSSGGSEPPPAPPPAPPTAPDTSAPDTTIALWPLPLSNLTTATFGFTANEAATTFEGRLDGGEFAAVNNPHTFTGLADGTHTFEVRARDAAGNVDPTPATFSWTVDTVAPQVLMQFPTPRSYTDASTITVRGIAADNDQLMSVFVNGVAAGISDDYSSWSVTIDVPVGTIPLEVTSEDMAGNSATATLGSIVNRGTFVHTPAGLAVDADRQRLLVVDGDTDAIVEVQTTDGVGRPFVAGQLPGTPSNARYGEIAVDAANGRALVIAHGADQLIEVDLDTGTRRVISAASGADGPTHLENAVGLALDPAGDNAYVAANLSVLRIDLANGTRTTVGGAALELSAPVDLIYDDVTNPASPRLLLLVADTGIFAIDPTTGTRTDFSTPGTGTGTPFSWPLAMALDASNQRLLVLDGNSGLMRVDLANGNRSPLTVAGITDFGVLSNGAAVFDDTTRHFYVIRRSSAIADIDVAGLSFSQMEGSSLPSPNGVGAGADGLAIEQASDRPASLIALGGVGFPLGEVTRFDLATGNGTLVSRGFDFGTGPALDTPLEMVLDRPANRALIAQGYIVAEPLFMEVDLESGDRTVLVADDGSGALGIPWRFAHDASANRLVYARIEPLGGPMEVHAVDLESDDISLLSGPAAGGPALGTPGQIILEPAANPQRALITDLASNRILSVDLVSGERSSFSTVDSGNAGSLFVDAESSRVFVSNVGAPAALITVPLSPGGPDRSLISGFDPVSSSLRGDGPAMHGVERIDVDLANGVVYAASRSNLALFAVDVATGDRIVIAR